MVRGTTHTRALLCKVMYVIHDDGSVVFSLQSSEEEKKKTHTHTHTHTENKEELHQIFFFFVSSTYSWPAAATATRWAFFLFCALGFWNSP
jgi:hypothetical protein